MYAKIITKCPRCGYMYQYNSLDDIIESGLLEEAGTDVVEGNDLHDARIFIEPVICSNCSKRFIPIPHAIRLYPLDSKYVDSLEKVSERGKI